MSRILVAFVRGYQLLISPFLPPSCRFHPTCSQYAIDTIRLNGPILGTYAALRRVCRCHPWSKGGADAATRIR